MALSSLSSLIDLRHELHAFPELSGTERATAGRIRAFLGSKSPDRIISVGETGLLISYYAPSPQKNVLFRSELDALPIQEKNVFEYHSRHKGISHMCGHDGHMAILAGLGDWCAGNRPERTNVHLLFQPSEETGQGARKVLEDPQFNLSPDFVFAIHNIPGYEENTILLKEHNFSASVVSIRIELHGKTSHAAEPEHGINPALAVSEIITVFDKLNHNHPGDDHFFICTPVYVRLGEWALGTSPGSAELGFTLRCWDNELMKKRQNTMIKVINEIAELHQLKLNHQWVEEFYANHNDPAAVALVRQSALRLNLPVVELKEPFKWGEDFGFFTSAFRGAMIGLGAGEDTPALHNPDYDFPDDILETGINIYQGILNAIDNP